jgi:hypothetical protein
MNRRLQLSPISNLPGSHSRQGWVDSLAAREQAKFFRSWLVYDSDIETNGTRGRFNWNMLLGVVFMVVVSTGGWLGIGLLARHFLK